MYIIILFYHFYFRIYFIFILKIFYICRCIYVYVCVFAHNTTYSDIILYFSCYTCYNKYCNKYFINLKYIAYKQGYIIVVKMGLKIKSLWKKRMGEILSETKATGNRKSCHSIIQSSRIA